MASTSNTNRLVLLIAVLVVAVGLIGYGPSPAQARTCQRPDFGELMEKCGKYVQKTKPSSGGKPSDECCKVLRGMDIPCACKYVTKSMESFVSPAKAIGVARQCGVTVNSGTKCGSKFLTLVTRFLELKKIAEIREAKLCAK
ncbi:hypothetical protein V2J09_012484 [Rumex salicifolius]